MKTNVIKILFITVAVCVFVNIVYQFYLNISNPYKTETVYEYAMEEVVSTDGFVFKDETVITDASSGVVNYLYTNGSHVAINSEVARIYQNQDDVQTTAQIESLEQQILCLNEAQSVGVAQQTDLSVVEKDFSNVYYNLIKDLNQDDLSDLSNEIDEINSLLNKKQIITGKAEDFNDTIAQLTAQKQSLESSIKSQPKSIITPSAGYFVDSVDGYEGVLSLDYAASITISELQDLLNQSAPSVSEGNVGKVIIDPILNFVGIASRDSLMNLKVGSECTLRFSELGIEVPATIANVQYDINQEKGLITFSIDYMSDRIATARKDHVDAVINSYEGLRIPKSAIRTNENGEQGVYVVNNVSMNFQKIDIIYESSEYVLSKPHSTDSEYLQLYDTIIVQGKDLYDNKPIKS